ncbi:hypothetical protein LAV72_11140 [Lysinibacillus xylanilyticus]|uniref:hypothetical protein n=1 Tax=Lysinibacillus xylanilyticus TaxID=582475 RepID=UPI002B23F508|nr:hypothetical protein [Lysinibacillus xylanilyticus]MEB2300174.1 hypothetical protein [Lysinibacillus xylanilyticus]
MGKLNPFILVRRNTLPKTSIELEKKKEICLLFEKMKTNDLLFLENKESAIELLEKKIAKSFDNNLLNLKRIIFNENYKKYINFIEKNDRLEDEVKQALRKLQKYWEMKNLLNQEYHALYEDLNVESRETLHLAANSKFIQDYLLMIQPNIYPKLKSYKETDVQDHKSRARKLDDTLFKVLARASIKTSPFANMTRVGLVEQTRSIKSNLGKLDLNANFANEIKINYTFLNRLIFEFLLQEDDFYLLTNYRTPPLSIENQKNAAIVNFVSTQDERKSAKIFETSEVLKKLKIPTELAAFLKKNSVKRDFDLSDISKALDNKLSNKELIALARKYVEIGLLVPTIGFSQCDDNEFFSEIINIGKKFLKEKNLNRLHNIIDQLIITKEKLHTVNSIEERNSIYRELETYLNTNDETKNIGMCVNHIFYEDGIITDKIPVINLYSQSDLDILSNLQKITLLFDVSVRMRLELGERVSQRGVNSLNSDFFTLLFETSKDILSYWSDPLYIGDNIKSIWIKKLDSLKIGFINELQELVSTSDVSVDITNLVNNYVEKIPQQLISRTDLSSSFFIQKNGDQLIINNIYDGQEKYKARFMDYFKEYLENDANYKLFEQEYYLNQGYYEYTENFGFNGNIKSIYLPRRVTTVGTGRKRFSQIAKNFTEIEEFGVTIDPVCHFITFFDRATNADIKVLFRGSLIPTAMPGYISTLLQLFSSGRMTFKFSDLACNDSGPRLTMGNVIISRKKESLSKYRDLFLADDVDGPEYHRKINEYFWKNNLATKFFVVAKRDFSDKQFKFVDFKPFYVDVANPISLRIFVKEIVKKYQDENYENLFIEENLGDDQNFATEFDLELYKEGGQV